MYSAFYKLMPDDLAIIELRQLVRAVSSRAVHGRTQQMVRYIAHYEKWMEFYLKTIHIFSTG